MSRQSRYKVVVVEPSPIVARGISELLSSVGEFEIVATLSDTSHLSERMTLLSPHIVIINPSTIENIKKFAQTLQDVAMVAISYSPQHEDTLRQFDEVLSIFDDAQHLVRRLRTALKQRDEESENDPSTSTYDLSDREIEILVCVARGMTNKEIADQNNISIHTVISHRKNITRKTGIKTVSGLTVYAIMNSLIEIDNIDVSLR